MTIPALEYELAPCPKCGATTEARAEKLCRPVRDFTDEYVCPGEFDQAGRAIQPTAASIKARDEWYAAEDARLEDADFRHRTSEH